MHKWRRRAEWIHSACYDEAGLIQVNNGNDNNNLVSEATNFLVLDEDPVIPI